MVHRFDFYAQFARLKISGNGSTDLETPGGEHSPECYAYLARLKCSRVMHLQSSEQDGVG